MPGSFPMRQRRIEVLNLVGGLLARCRIERSADGSNQACRGYQSVDGGYIDSDSGQGI